MKATLHRLLRVSAAGPARMLRGLAAGALLWVIVAPVMAPVAAPPAAHGTPPTPTAWTTSLRVRTPEYTLAARGPTAPGYRLDDTPGAPALPVWGTVVELPAVGDYEIAFESPGARLLPGQAGVGAAPVPDLAVIGGARPPAAWAEELAAAPVVDRPDPAIYRVDAFYPASPVVAGGVQRQAGRRLLALRVFPFQFNPVTKMLRYHPDVRITVRVPQAAGDASSPTAGLSTTGADPAAANAAAALRVRTAGRGMIRLTYADLLAAGVPLTDTIPPDPATFAITYLGEPVAAEVTGDGDAAFEDGELVVFYAQPYTGRYQTENVYWFTYGGAAGLRMAARSVARAAVAPITAITQTLRVERNQEYRSEYPRPRDADHWFDLPLSPDLATGVFTATRVYDLALDDALPTGDVLLTATFHGALDQAADPDKAVELQLNSHLVGDYRWDGRTYTTTTAVVPAAYLAPAANQITLTAAISLLTGVDFYTVSPDWIELAYPAAADAEGDRIYIEGIAAAGDGGDPNQVTVTGFITSAVSAYDLRDPNRPVRLLTTDVVTETGSYTVSVWDEDAAGAAYFLASEAGLAAPAAVERPALDATPSPLRSATNQADYIAIVHRSLWEAIDPLLAHRQTQDGLAVAKADVQQVYDEFSSGRRDPEAIRSFLAYAYGSWKGPDGNAAAPRYVLLVGDGHYDFTGVSGTAYPNLLPPYLVHIDPWLGETAADNRFASVDPPVDGVEDILPEMAVGRIPARTAADVTAAVDKILAYETAAAGDWQARVVFVADNDADPAGDFHAYSDEVRLNWLPPEYDDRTIYYNLDYFTADAMRTAIKGAFNDDAVLLQWFGHGSKFRWGSISMFNHYDPAALNANDVWPFSLSYSCWTGYFINLFVSNTGQSLGEHLLLTPARGSAADLSPSGLHVGSALLTLNEGVTLAVFRDRIRPVGEAVDQAKLYYFAHGGGYPDVIDTSILFGDPALKLRVPATPPTAPVVAIAAEGSAAGLSWPHNLDSSQYEVWRGTAAYFDPEAAGVRVATAPAGFRGAAGPDLAFSDDGTAPPPPVTIIGDVATNYFWVVRSRNGDGVSELSNRVGEFDFALTPGE